MFYRVSVVLFLLGVWLLETPYFGILGDGIFYAGQALNRISPGTYAGDIFFAYGSQDDFTLFTPLYAWFVDFFGLETAAFILTITGKLLWFTAILWFASALLSGQALWIGIALIVTMDPAYDGFKAFKYGESILTSRLYAEVFVLFGLGCFLRSQKLTGIACLGSATLFHPLMALPGLVVAMFSWSGRPEYKKILIISFVGSLIIALSALIGVSPFERILEVYDGEWLSVVKERNQFVYLHNWSIDGYAYFLTSFLFLWLVSLFHKEAIKYFAFSVFLVAVIFLLVSWFAGFVLDNVLLVQLQLWRVLWLVRLSALCLIGGLFVLLWNSGAQERLLLVFLGTSLLLDGVATPLMVSLGLVLYFFVRNDPGFKIKGIVRVALFFVMAFGIISKLFMLNLFFEKLGYDIWSVFVIICTESFLVVGFVVIFSRLKVVGMFSARWISLISGAFLLFGVWNFDKRLRATEELGYSERDLAMLRSSIPEGALVLWPDNSSLAWLWLQRGHYVSNAQLAGALYSKEMVIEARRRQKFLEPFGFAESKYGWGKDVQKELEIVHWRDDPYGAMAYICQEPLLDQVILPLDDDRMPMVGGTPRLKLAGLELYNCADFRR